MLRKAYSRPPRKWPSPNPEPARATMERTDLAVATPKEAPVRDREYREWVASTACRRCGIVGHGQAAHPNTGKGGAIKTSDLLVFCLCAAHDGLPGCHWFLDQSGKLKKQERRDLENLYISSQQMEALLAGRPEMRK